MQRHEMIFAIDEEIARLEQVRHVLVGAEPSRGPGRPKGSQNKAKPTPVSAPAVAQAKSGKRMMSAEGKARIAAAQKARWAAHKQAQNSARRSAKLAPTSKTA